MSSTAYLTIGYLVTWVVLAWYRWRLGRKWREARRLLKETARPDPKPAGAPPYQG